MTHPNAVAHTRGSLVPDISLEELPSSISQNTINVTHWGLVTHIMRQRTASSNGQRGHVCYWADTWTNVGLLSIGPSGTYFIEISIKIHKFSFMKMHSKMPSAKWRLFCLSLNELQHAGSRECHGNPRNHGSYRNARTPMLATYLRNNPHSYGYAIAYLTTTATRPQQLHSDGLAEQRGNIQYPFSIKRLSLHITILITKITWSWDHLIHITGIPSYW